MKAPPFGYVRAQSLDDVFLLRADCGAEARLLAGGQSLLATLAFRLSDPGTLIDIGRVAELRGIDGTLAGDIRIGALTTHSELCRSDLVRERLPVLAHAASLIAHPAIRNRGTIGGSLAYADPAAELPAVCVALDARIVAASPGGERRIAAAQFFTGLFETALAADEVICAVELAARSAARPAVILEVARRRGDYAMAGIVLAAGRAQDRLIDPSIVFFGVGSGPVQAAEAMAILDGRPAGGEALAAAQAALDRDLDPPTDQHGGPAMKRHLARVLLARALAALREPGKARAA
jgi:carbon-monoxide dehydrogenase medium subunit